jgi:PAS domain S-box-containing protein
VLGYQLPFITFFPATFLAAWWYGARPTLLAVLLSTALASVFFFPPHGAEPGALLLNLIGVALFVAIGLGTALMGERRLAAERRAGAEAAAARQAEILSEHAAVQAEEEASRARAAQARLEWQAGLLEQTHDAVLVWELEGRLVYWNRAAELLYGWPRDEVLGKRSHELLRSNPAEADSMSVVETLLRQRGEWSGELRQWTRDGKALTVESRQVVLAAQSGPALILESNRDITDRKQVEEQLRHSQQMDAIGQLAGGVAHDFNNVLTAISGYSGFLLAALPPDDHRREDVLGIQGAAERAAGLTQQLLAFGRKQVMQPTVLDVREVIEDTGRMLRRLIGEHIDLAIVTGPLVSPVVADPGQLSQVLVNLVVNARDAMSDGGRLTIEARDVRLTEAYATSHLAVRPGPYVQIAVSDTGRGMTPEVQSHMFEPFFTTKPRGKGTGLGLSTVFGIVKQFGGHIFVYSEPGHGTTVKIYLPRAESAVASSMEVPESSGTGRDETILLVEDDAAIRGVVRRTLENRGYYMLAAETPGLALELAGGHEGRIHLLLTDLMMPGMTGPQLAARLVVERPELKVLYMSGYADNAIAHQERLGPATEFLPKPFAPEVLARRVRQVLDQPAKGSVAASG